MDRIDTGKKYRRKKACGDTHHDREENKVQDYLWGNIQYKHLRVLLVEGKKIGPHIDEQGKGENKSTQGYDNGFDNKLSKDMNSERTDDFTDTYFAGAP